MQQLQKIAKHYTLPRAMQKTKLTIRKLSKLKQSHFERVGCKVVDAELHWGRIVEQGEGNFAATSLRYSIYWDISDLTLKHYIKEY